MNPTPITIVADTSTDGLLDARALVWAGFSRLTTHVGDDALRAALADDEAPGVLVLDLFVEHTTDEALAGLGLCGLDLGEAVIVAVTADKEAALTAGADFAVAPRDPDALGQAVALACAMRRSGVSRPLAHAA